MKNNEKISRLFADDKGESHFGEIEITTTTPFPDWSVNVSQALSKANGEINLWMEVKQGVVFEWVNPPQKLCFVYLSGSLSIESSSGEVKHFSTGDILIVEDLVGKGHTTKILEDLTLLAIPCE